MSLRVEYNPDAPMLKTHSTTYVRSGAEAGRVAARLSREQRPEREPGADDGDEPGNDATPHREL